MLEAGEQGAVRDTRRARDGANWEIHDQQKTFQPFQILLLKVDEELQEVCINSKSKVP